MERYEWNKSQRYQSIVAMNLLSWNLARNLKATDVGLYQAIRSALQQSLRNSIQTQSFVRSKNVPVKFHGRRKNEPAHYCGLCDEEVFNNLLVKEHEKRHVVHCLRCSVSADPELKGMICLEEYTLDELCLVYEDFKLVSTCTASMPTSGLGYCEKSTVIPTIKTTTSLKAVGVEEL
jgi:histone demethylase